MKRGFKFMTAALTALILPALGWGAEADVTGVIPWAKYTFDNTLDNTGSGARTWNGGGSVSYTIGVSGGEKTAAIINKWTVSGNQSISDGFTLSIVTTQGTSLNDGANNGHIFSLADKGSQGTNQWALKNTATSGKVRIAGLFTSDYDITLPEYSATFFNHFVIRIAGDRSQADVFLNGGRLDTTGYTVNKNVVDDAFFGYQVGGRWGGGNASNATVDDLRIYTVVLTDEQVAALSQDVMPVGEYRRSSSYALQANSTVNLSLTTTEALEGSLVLNVPNNGTLPDGITWTLFHGETEIEHIVAFDSESKVVTLTFAPLLTGYEEAGFSYADAPEYAKLSTPAGTVYYGDSPDYAAVLTGGKQAVVVKITDSTDAPSVYAGSNTGKLDCERWVMVAGGNIDTLYGGNNSDNWQNSTSRNLNGDVFIETVGGEINYIVGGSRNDANNPTILGDINIRVSDTAKISGSIIGAGIASHSATATYGSDFRPTKITVDIKNVQGENTTERLEGGAANNESLTAGYIIGGGAYRWNASSKVVVKGETAVNVELADTASGTFIKNIIGGGYIPTGCSAQGNSARCTVTGRTQVNITAPNGVTFASDIIGGGYNTTTISSTPVGSSAVTLNGGTYTGSIYAGGKGTNATVGGDAVLTLKSGNFAAAKLYPADGETATIAGDSILAIDGDIDLSTTTIGNFDQVTIAAGKTLTLGTNRLTADAPLQAGLVADWATIAIRLTAEEIAAKSVAICAYDGDVLPTISISNKPEDENWIFVASQGVLYAVVKTSHNWSPGATSWANGFSSFKAGDDISFGDNTNAETILVPEDLGIGKITVNGDYTLVGSNNAFTASLIEVQNEASLTLQKIERVKYVRLRGSDSLSGSDHNAIPGFAELILVNGETPVSWPLGTTICEKNFETGTVTDAGTDWDNGEEVNALIDGFYRANGVDTGSSFNPKTGVAVTYTSNSAASSNKWWPAEENAAAYAVITLGTPITFDGYRLVSSDYRPRNAQAWTLDVSVDGETWYNIDTVTDQEVPNPSVDNDRDDGGFYVSDSATGSTIFSADFSNRVTAPVMVNGTLSGCATISGDVTVGETGAIVVNGTDYLTIEGTLSGSVKFKVPNGTILAPLAKIAEANLNVVPTISDVAESKTAYNLEFIDGVYYAYNTAVTALSASIAENKNLSEIVWGGGEGTVGLTLPFAKDYPCTLTATQAATVTMDMDATFPSLTIGEGAEVTFAGENSLTAAATAINADTDVSGITANLGTISGTAGTLTVGPGTTVPTSVSNVTIGFSGTAENPLQYASTESSVASWAKFCAGRTGAYAFSGYVNVDGYSASDATDSQLGWLRFRANPQTVSIVDGANITAVRLVTSDGDTAVTTVNQTGGTITLSGTETGCNNTGANAVLLGHWPATTTYNLAAGSLLAENGALNLGWDGPAYLTIGQDSGDTTALVSVKRFSGSTQRNGNASVTIKPTGTLQIGSGGLDLPTNKSFTLAGGTLAVTDDATIAISHTNGLNITEDSTIRVAENATARYAGTVKGSSILTKTGTGTLNLSGATLPDTLRYTVNGGTLILPAGKEGTEVDDVITSNVTINGGTLVLQLSEQQIFDGYTAKVASGTEVAFYGPYGTEIDDPELVNGNTYVPALNTWTPAEDNTWSNTENWSWHVIPEDTDNIQIEINADTELTLSGNISVGIINIVGSGTLTIAGGKLTAAKVFASANVTATGDTLALVPMTIAEGKTVDYATDGTITLPALTGSGTFSKFGSGTVNVNAATECETHIVMNSGTLNYNQSATYEKAYKLTVKDDAVVQIGNAFAILNSTENVFNMEGGSKLKLQNGNSYVLNRPVTASYIISNATEENPVIIEGSMNGDVADVSGTISGNGVVALSQSGNTYIVSADISENVKVRIDQGTVTLSGANTYTGGTEIAAGTTLKITNSGALGSGVITGVGTLACAENLLPTNKNGLTTGTAATADAEATGWTGTVKFTGLVGSANGNPMWGLDPADYGNSASTIEFAGTNDGWLEAQGSCASAICVSGTLTFNNGYSSNGGYTFSGSLSGEGTIATSGAVTDVIQFTGNTSGFAGTITVEGGHCISFGAHTNNANDNGQLLIQSDKTANIAANKTWTATNGVHVYGTIGGTGSIGTSETSSNLTLNDGATLDASAGALTATGTVNWPTGESEKVNFKLGAVTTGASIPLMKITKDDYTFDDANIAKIKIFLGTTDITEYLAAEGRVYFDAETTTLYARTAAGTSTTTGPIWAALEVAKGKVTTATSISGITLTGDAELDAAGVFDGLLSATANATDETKADITVKDYNFGISGITAAVEDGITYVIITATVEGIDTEATVDYAEGANVNLYKGDKKLDGVEVLDAADAQAYGLSVVTVEGGAPTYSLPAGVKYLKVPFADLFSTTTPTSSETAGLTVKAEKTNAQ